MLSTKMQGISHTLKESCFMTAMLIKKPEFHPRQRVSFAGGEGVVRSYISESGSWTYLIEMSLGPEPDFGRVGAETAILLNEADLYAA
jgi:hypothetical protein